MQIEKQQSKPRFDQHPKPCTLVQDILEQPYSNEMSIESPIMVQYNYLHQTDEQNSQDLNQAYDFQYGQDFDLMISKNQVDFSYLLKNHKIQPQMRAKMVNWMYEVLGNFKDTTSNETYVLAIQLMDLYFKKTLVQLKESDVHIIGIVCLYIASKLNDIYHIPLENIYERVGHKKFTLDQLKAKEADILMNLEFNISFPTVYKILNRILFKNFYQGSSVALQTVQENSKLIMKMVLFDEKMLNYKPIHLASSVVIYSIKTMFLEQKMKNQSQINKLIEQEDKIIHGILESLNCNQDCNIIEQCILQINSLIQNFDNLFYGLDNFQKFQLED